ncbi:hypothetical protein [Microvirga calopogonii]|uniref:hypothetical protein n=1 Tax=Microvirga calopogonii TaxID=2078013 RepID=UPI0013B41B8F|nr:hypothetical protein [Microvirga calopogonii]
MDSVPLDRQPARDPSASLSPWEALNRGEAPEAQTLPFRAPQQVLMHPGLGVGAKRAILASWVSDACAVENLPNWRKLPGTGALVALDDILDALRALDGGALH